MMEKIGIALLVWNGAVFLIYGLDKSNAESGRWRISEKSLVAMSFLMGGAGAFAGMHVFHHKTKHRKFKLLIPFALILNSAIVMVVLNGL